MSILSPQEKIELFAKLDEAGEEKVLENLARKVYGSNKITLVNEWLRKQEENRNQEKSDLESSFKREEISVAKEANRLTLAANSEAREANAIALSASREASESTRIARHNRNIAIAALIISIVSAIISLCKK